MNWLINNWSFLVVIACVFVIFYLYAKKFSQLPTEEQKAIIKKWLLAIVIEAEKEFGGGGTGRLKLSYAYDLFIQRFPSLVNVITFELFASLVDEVLEEMRKLLKDNQKISEYVNGGES